jgi:hypothetical protein
MRSFSLLVLCSFSPLLFAADVPGSQDLPIVPRMVDAQIVDYRPAVELERIYPLGSIRKISGQLRFDGQVSARGNVTSVTYEARDCGESSLWANEVFGNAKLYGADDQQAYLLLRLAAPRDNTLVALYSITRGNRKAYLHVEQFDASAPLGELLPTSATLLRELKSTGELDFSRLNSAPDETWLRLISRGLNLDTTLRVSISGANAEAWRQALITQGVRAARMETGSTEGSGLHIELLR